jgi:hypothetical protein
MCFKNWRYSFIIVRPTRSVLSPTYMAVTRYSPLLYFRISVNVSSLGISITVKAEHLSWSCRLVAEIVGSSPAYGMELCISVFAVLYR